MAEPEQPATQCCENCKHYPEDVTVFDCPVKQGEVDITSYKCVDWIIYTS